MNLPNVIARYGRECEMFINVIRAPLKTLNCFLIFFCHFRFRYKCSHLIKYLLPSLVGLYGEYFALCLCTELDEAPWSVQRPRVKYPSVQTSRSVNKNT